MKSLCFAAICLVAGVASAVIPVEGGNVAALIPVTLSTATKTTLISVPLTELDAAGTGDNISFVNQFLPPANYPEGSRVFLYSGADANYYGWENGKSGETSVWNPMLSSEAGSPTVIEAPPAGAKTLNVGTALWLQLPADSTETTAYLAGQWTPLNALPVETGHNLVAFGGADPVKLSAITVLNPVAGTPGKTATFYRVLMPQDDGTNISFAYMGEKWYNMLTGAEIVGDAVLIPAGKGFWFVNPHVATTIQIPQ